MTLNRILFSLALIVAFNANLIGQKTLNSNSVRNAYPICHFEQLDIDIIAEQNQELLEFQSAYKVDALLISNRPAWYVFKPLNNDVITFEIIPNDQYNDVDFILYEANHLASSIVRIKRS